MVGGFKYFLFSISYMGCHPSHWRTPSFFRRVARLNHQPDIHSLRSPTLQIQWGQRVTTQPWGLVALQVRLITCWIRSWRFLVAWTSMEDSENSRGLMDAQRSPTKSNEVQAEMCVWAAVTSFNQFYAQETCGFNQHLNGDLNHNRRAGARHEAG